jgi:hypothetical protein
MLKYILSRPSAVNTKSPTIINGKVQSYEVVSKNPTTNNSLSVNIGSGLLSFTGSANSQISINDIFGENSGGQYVDYMYTVTPIELSFGSIPATTTSEVVIPDYISNMSVEFVSGGSISDVSGGYLAMLPVTPDDVFSGSNVTTNIIETNYYVSNTVHSYSFSGLNLSITYPIKIGFPITGVTESDFLATKAYQNSGGTMAEKTTTYSSYSGSSSGGTVFVELNTIQNSVAVVTLATYYTPYEVYTGITLTQAGNNWEANNANKVTIYLQTPSVLTNENDKLEFWVNGMKPQSTANSLVFYSNNIGTKYVPPNPTPPLGSNIPAETFGIFHVYKGWFVQIANTSQLVRTSGSQNRQFARQIIPVITGTTKAEACYSVTKRYLVNNSDTVYGKLDIIKTKNFVDLDVKSQLIYSLDSSFPYFFSSPKNSVRVNSLYFRLTNPIHYPSSQSPCCGYVISNNSYTTTASGEILSGPITCNEVLPTMGLFAVRFSAETSAEGVVFYDYNAGVVLNSSVLIYPTDTVTAGTDGSGSYTLLFPFEAIIRVEYVLLAGTSYGNYTVEIYQEENDAPFNDILIFTQTFNDGNLSDEDVYRTFYTDGIFQESPFIPAALIKIRVYSDKTPVTPTPTPTETPTQTPTPTPTRTPVTPTPTSTPDPTPTRTPTRTPVTPTPTSTPDPATPTPTPTGTPVTPTPTPTGTPVTPTPTSTPDPTPTRTPTRTPTPTLPLGDCFSVYNSDLTENIYVIYTNRSGDTSACAAVGPDSTSYICVKTGTGPSIVAYYGDCAGSGGSASPVVSGLGGNCSDAADCIP